jgi:hemerythrin superfamily protein
MATATNGKNIDINKLWGEINLLRSFVIGITGKDKEGNYRPEFVKKILESTQEKEKLVFRGTKRFLSELKQK